ncbi:MAG: methionyl-tRNA formyltransferase, partial [Patescibacteria group bacterium]
LIEISNAMLIEVLPKYVTGDIAAYPQNPAVEPTYSRKLSKEDGRIDWGKPAEQIEREIRAFAGWPKSYTTTHGIEIALTKAHILDAHGKPGATTTINKKPVIYAGEQALAIDRLKPAGKKEMTGEAFLAGYGKQFLSEI